ncbi:tRNA (adenosine(37)-N6)-threonylcarbamoyltransferase complex transferase subunit TsaD [Candidatus Saccharibacteria bacterium]|nr:tRNA (adenosine(37)-N6)-threonylcarbamoyltransferase complex transferase subunit TsaD [Candidatus Saccharibacteria bacterium]MCL1963170.1 tRNA (adenosine(37)-N6)-threonylcarbamoyltransferase complex transferase subunit TsaD [Candidatus Saccharibacteria bacterium]
MKILGIESSCDETAAAVVENGRHLISNVVNSQIDIHSAFGGVVPEVAARSHLEVILPVIDKAVQDAGGWNEIDAIACTTMPGLIGSLLIGSLTARTLALLKNKPFYPIHHVEAHVYANFLDGDAPRFPLLALIVSGGHSQIVLFRDHGDYELIGQTADDAVGEAFDKVAKILGLPYPGGPSIAKAAEHGDPLKYSFPKAKMAGKYDFSFSGLKTAVLRAVQSECGKDHTYPSNALSALLTPAQCNDFAASFQHVAVETLVDKVIAAFDEFAPKSVVIAGGVAANQELRRQLAARLPIKITFPDPQFCTDNAAMVATLGYYVATGSEPTDPRDVELFPSISMTKTAWKLN